MTLTQWAENGWLRKHRAQREEIRNLLAIADRDIQDATGGVSSDWQFGIAYNAALKLCTVLLNASGYRAEKSLHHYRTIQALPEILGKDRKPDAEYLDACRSKRNVVEYDYVGAVTEDEVSELVGFVRELKEDVLVWLKTYHPEFL